MNDEEHALIHAVIDLSNCAKTMSDIAHLLANINFEDEDFDFEKSMTIKRLQDIALQIFIEYNTLASNVKLWTEYND